MFSNRVRCAGLRVFVSVVLLVGLGGVGSSAAASAGPQPGVTFVSKEMRLTAYFDQTAVRLVFSDGRDVVLPQVRSASGARYTDGSILFWNKGDEARLELDGVTYHVRVADPSLGPWERARRAGIDFRAVGQEPGWFVEIRDGERIHLTLDYGQTQVTTPISAPDIDPETGATMYQTYSPMSPLDIAVIIQDEACHDAMSGEAFPARVAVELRGSGPEYHGCGQPL